MPCLGLVPRNPLREIDTSRLETLLLEIGFVDGAFSYRGERHLSLGDRFFSLISFLGCMPFLILDPEEGTAGDELGFCHASIVVSTAEPVCFTDSVSRTMKCRECGSALVLENAFTAEDGVTCGECHVVSSWENLRLGETGAIGKAALIIHGVHRSEGVPAPELLSALARQTNGEKWRYFYLDDYPAGTVS